MKRKVDIFGFCQQYTIHSSFVHSLRSNNKNGMLNHQEYGNQKEIPRYNKNKVQYPAKSTRWSLDLLIVADPLSREVTWIVNIQCDRVEAWFMGVCKNIQYRKSYSIDEKQSNWKLVWKKE